MSGSRKHGARTARTRLRSRSSSQGLSAATTASLFRISWRPRSALRAPISEEPGAVTFRKKRPCETATAAHVTRDELQQFFSCFSSFTLPRVSSGAQPRRFSDSPLSLSYHSCGWHCSPGGGGFGRTRGLTVRPDLGRWPGAVSARPPGREPPPGCLGHVGYTGLLGTVRHFCPTLLSDTFVPHFCPTLLSHTFVPHCCPTLLSDAITRFGSSRTCLCVAVPVGRTHTNQRPSKQGARSRLRPPSACAAAVAHQGNACIVSCTCLLWCCVGRAHMHAHAHCCKGRCGATLPLLVLMAVLMARLAASGSESAMRRCAMPLRAQIHARSAGKAAGARPSFRSSGHAPAAAHARVGRAGLFRGG